MENLLILLMMAAAYFFPTIIAWARRHNNTLAIFMLNLILGATGICWIIALIWACTNNVSKPQTNSQPEETNDVA